MTDVGLQTADAEAFVAKWRGAWPEWAIAEVFLPTRGRELAAFWQALQFELQEAAWGGADARPGEAKLGWWVEELSGWAAGRRRHPLGVRLLAQPAPWTVLAQALPALAASRARPASPEAARRALDPVAVAVAACDAALLGGQPRADAVAACWLYARLARHPDEAVPAGLDSRGAWADALRSAWPQARDAAAARRVELALARGRLHGGDPALPLGPLATLWTGWRAARH